MTNFSIYLQGKKTGVLITGFIFLFIELLILPTGCVANRGNSNPASIASGLVVHIKDFGAKGDGKTNNTLAFQKASNYLQANGGTLIIDSGIYIVGAQRQSKTYGAGSSFFDEPILFFKEAKLPIVITGYKATLKAADQLKWGSFNPITGKKDSLRKTSHQSDYYASAYNFIRAVGCASITIKGLTIDGNSGNLDIGPSFTHEGIQLAATGLSLFNNKSVLVEDCYIHHCGLDAIVVAWTGLTENDPIYPHVIKNVKATYNGRQSLSWVGGNSLTVTDSEFSSTGKAFNKKVPVVSKPSAGIDIEIEESIIRNGNFINCMVNDNAGPGVISIGHDTYNINFKNSTFIGTTNSAVYPKSQGFSFDSCTFVGKVERIFGSADKAKAISFKNSLFTMDVSKSPTGKVFGEYCEFYEGTNVVFENCEFNAGSRRLPVFSNREITFLNCSFQQDNAVDFNASATFKGINKFNLKGKGNLEKSQSKFDGSVLLNNRKIH